MSAKNNITEVLKLKIINRKIKVSRSTNSKQSNKQGNKQTNKQTNKQREPKSLNPVLYETGKEKEMTWAGSVPTRMPLSPM
jgi:hypothetical protein